jgi:N4-gp56 family major capsid protein
MATSLAYTNSIDVTDSAVFIPEIWSDEIIAAYKSNLVLAGLVNNLNHKKKKGDVIHFPKFTSYPSASAKAANNVVTLVTATDTEVTVTIDKHYEFSFVEEDIVAIQAMDSVRQAYTDRAGYALAKQIDNDIRDLAATWNSGTAYSGAYIGSDGSTAYSATSTGNGAAFTDDGIRRLVQRFDDGDVPSMDRFLVVPPVEKKRMLAVPRWVETSFIGESGSGNSIRNGLIGDLYGLKLYVSTNVAEITAADGSTDYRVCLAFQKQALLLAIQNGVRVQTQPKLEALGTLFVSDVLYGVKTIREEGCDAYVVPAL